MVRNQLSGGGGGGAYSASMKSSGFRAPEDSRKPVRRGAARRAAPHLLEVVREGQLSFSSMRFASSVSPIRPS